MNCNNFNAHAWHGSPHDIFSNDEGSPSGWVRIGAPGVFDNGATSSGASKSDARAVVAASALTPRLPSSRRRVLEGGKAGFARRFSVGMLESAGKPTT